jgi:hypothetical protein
MKMSFYEQLGIVIPGSVLMFGLTLYYPALQLITGKDGLSVGDLGLFVLIAYAAGHLVAQSRTHWRRCSGEACHRRQRR